MSKQSLDFQIVHRPIEVILFIEAIKRREIKENEYSKRYALRKYSRKVYNTTTHVGNFA